jgi:hypothetical protein
VVDPKLPKVEGCPALAIDRQQPPLGTSPNRSPSEPPRLEESSPSEYVPPLLALRIAKALSP